ncbi:MAG: VOC family protein, partial [Pseudomonadota bacterium]
GPRSSASRFQGFARLTTWICRSDDLKAHVSRDPRAGVPVALTRGDLNWRMAVPEDGKLPFDHSYPAVMQWDCTAHPAARLAPSGCRLTRLVVCHPEAQALRQDLGGLEDTRIIYETGAPALRAEFDTPFGSRVLS